MILSCESPFKSNSLLQKIITVGIDYNLLSLLSYLEDIKVPSLMVSTIGNNISKDSYLVDIGQFIKNTIWYS